VNIGMSFVHKVLTPMPVFMNSSGERICFVAHGWQYDYTATPRASRICAKLTRCKGEVFD